MEKVIQRFWGKVKIPDNPKECWLWTAGLRNGYGQFWFEGSTVYSHRFSYELLIGPIPEGLQLDHVRSKGCVNRNCVNPDHLEPVTNQINSQRGMTGHHMTVKAIANTSCPSGHPYEGENLLWDSEGYKRCRICHLEGRRRRYAIKQGAKNGRGLHT